MYLHLGGDTVVATGGVLGIFDLDNASWSKHPREFLRRVQQEGRVINVTDDLPRSMVLCRVGGEERDIHFDRMSDGQGASMALPIWGLYMNKVYADKNLPYSQEEKFDIPEDFDPCKSLLLQKEEEEALEPIGLPSVEAAEEGEVSEEEEEDGFADFFN